MTYIIAEIGLNHNGSLTTALDMIKSAKECGCDAVKFQKRDPETCVPRDQWAVPRETPWGVMSYIEYRHKMEFGISEYDVIDQYCAEMDIEWFASAWDLPSLEFIYRYDIPYVKIPSAMLTNDELLEEISLNTVVPILSTGMSTISEIDRAVSLLQGGIIMHCTSSYPCPIEELNLLAIPMLIDRYGLPVGYSGHEVGLATTISAVTLGARYVERHFTLDRAMWGTDQSASVEPQGMARLVRDIRTTEIALGDGVKRVYESEEKARVKLRGVPHVADISGRCGK